VSPVKYELGFYIPEDDILHSHRRENFKSLKFTASSNLSQSPIIFNSTLGRTSLYILCFTVYEYVGHK
jgi:hypothetical protein